MREAVVVCVEGAGWTARGAVAVCVAGAGWTAHAAACAAMREVVAVCVAGSSATREVESGVGACAVSKKWWGKVSSRRARQ